MSRLHSTVPCHVWTCEPAAKFIMMSSWQSMLEFAAVLLCPVQVLLETPAHKVRNNDWFTECSVRLLRRMPYNLNMFWPCAA